MLKQLLPLVCCFIFGINNAQSLDLSDCPLEVQLNSAQPILMIILDNSASMNAEYLTAETDGLFKRHSYLFPSTLTLPDPSNAGAVAPVLPENKRRLWKSQWSGYNGIFYAPNIAYSPWTGDDDTAFDPADVQRPCFDPVKCSQNSGRISLGETFMKVHVGGVAYSIANAHYFSAYDTDDNGTIDQGEPVYLVTWTDVDGDGVLDVSGHTEDDRRLFFRYIDDGDERVEDNELTLVDRIEEKNLIKPALINDDGAFQRYKTDLEDLQNFANWFSYYRTRGLCLKAAAGLALSSVEQVQAGLYAVNGHPRTAAVARDGERDPSNNSLHRQLYQMEFAGDATLHSALDAVGRYYHQDFSSVLGRSPFAPEEEGGGCQPVHALIVTDGYEQISFSGVGNTDGDNGPPYADSWHDTLADVAMYYYENDLAPQLPDSHPGQGCDEARHQHMITHVLAFGPPVSHEPGDSNSVGSPDNSNFSQNACLSRSLPQITNWPQPLSGTSSVMDDIWHAAVNGRGDYRSTRNPMILAEAFSDIIGRIQASPQTYPDTMISGLALDQDSSVIVQSSYSSSDWSGDLKAFPFDTAQASSGNAKGNQLWMASTNLKGGKVNSDNRRIVSYGGFWRDPMGIPFRYDSLSDAQRAALGSDLVRDSILDNYARRIVDFLRGTEMIPFRPRISLLGDIVHADPVIAGQTVFSGANDGMLHAFSLKDGSERFAFIPNLVFNNLTRLSRNDYLDSHRFFVDGPLYAGEVFVGRYRRATYLVGGLGKGGKGYYCLRLKERHRPGQGDEYGDYVNTFNVDELDSGSSEQEVCTIVSWEYPRPQSDDDGMDNNGNGLIDESNEIDPDIGFSYSRAYVVNANSANDTFRPIVIFGNGYESKNQKAVLYILDAQKGTLIRKIETGESHDNGLSCPALIDVNMDGCVDYVYAGDLKGNLWKFDLTAKNPKRWGVAYGHDLNGDGIIDAANGDLALPVFKTDRQSITARPNIMRMHAQCGPRLPGFMVIFGTGRYLGDSDRRLTHRDALYGIWDYGDDDDDSEIVGTLLEAADGRLSTGLILVRRQILDETIEAGKRYRRLSQTQPVYTMVDDHEDNDGNRHNNHQTKQEGNPAHIVGWYLELQSDMQSGESSVERIIQDIELRNGLVLAASFTPSGAPCSHGGHAWLYLLGACSGTPPDNEAGESILPWQQPTAVSSNLHIVKSSPKSHKDVLFFADRLGQLQCMEFPGEKWGKRFWRENIMD